MVGVACVSRLRDVESNLSTGARGWFVSNESTVVSAADAALATPGNASSYAEAYGDANATWRWFDGAAFDAEGEISMNVAAAWIEVYGLEHSAHMMGSARQTEAEHEKLRAAREAADGCPPPHGVYARVDAGDFGSSLTAPFVDENTTVPDPPWTVEAWVRRDVALVSQALFTGPTGGSIALEAAPATGRLAVVVPETAAETRSARGRSPPPRITPRRRPPPPGASPRKPPRKCSTTPRRSASGRTSRSSPFQMVCRTSRPARPCDYTRTARIAARSRTRGCRCPSGRWAVPDARRSRSTTSGSGPGR